MCELQLFLGFPLFLFLSRRMPSSGARVWSIAESEFERVSVISVEERRDLLKLVSFSSGSLLSKKEKSGKGYGRVCDLL